MKNLLITGAGILLIPFLCFFNKINAQEIASSGFVINGNINGLDKGTMMLVYPASGKIIADSTAIENGAFHFKGSVNAPVSADLYVKEWRNQSLNFYLENSAIHIALNRDSIGSSKVTGSLSNVDYDSVKALMAPYYECLSSLRILSNFASKQHLDSVSAYVDKIYDELPRAQRKRITDYALSHPGSYAITNRLFINFTNDQTELPLLKEVYDNFSASVKKSEGGKSIAALMKRMERVQVGNKAPDFSLPNERGEKVQLSSFKGKYVLLDFWASWCVPCRAESPSLVKAFNKYKSKNFTIVSVSLDVEKDKQKWLDAIQKDGLTWTNVSSLKGYEEEGVRQLYSVQGIPDNFLISPGGKIIARGLRGAEVEAKLAELIK